MVDSLGEVQVGQLLRLDSYGQSSVVKVVETTALYVVVESWPGVKFKKANGWPVLSSRLKRQRLRPITAADWQGPLLRSLYQRLKEQHQLNVSLDEPLRLVQLYYYLNERSLF